jgi:predicted nuclease of predicted toxin-antitoxin system
MKIKLDENLPAQLATNLEALVHDVQTVHQEGLTGRADPDVWTAAQEDARFLVTQDLDFSDTRKFTPGLHQGILLVRLHQVEAICANE